MMFREKERKFTGEEIVKRVPASRFIIYTSFCFSKAAVMMARPEEQKNREEVIRVQMSQKRVKENVKENIVIVSY